MLYLICVNYSIVWVWKNKCITGYCINKTISGTSKKHQVTELVFMLAFKLHA